MTPPATRSRSTTQEKATDSSASVTPVPQATTDRMTAEVMAALRQPFPDNVVGKLPRQTCRACKEAARQWQPCERHQWIERCDVCQGKHSSATMHIDYVGHAAITDRLLAVDPEWTWEPMGTDEAGLPAIVNGCLWIRLTVKGVTRIGVGDATNDSSGSTAKVLIGDALRNAAMRFGLALDLWSKQDLAEVNPITDPIFLQMVLDNIAEASTREALQEIGQVVRSNAGYLSKEDRAAVNQAWIERRDKMGQPS